jgi:outer membrane protein with beta-barrel domain
MKNFIIVLLLFVSATAFAQHGLGYYEYDVDKFFRVGFNGGVNIDKIQGKSFTNEYSLDYAVRGFMVFNLSQKFGLQPEAGYSQQSAKQSNDYRVIWDEISSSEDQLKVRLNYLKFGTMINYNVGATTTRVKLQFGPQWGMLLSEKVDSLKTSQDIFKKSDFSLAVGILFQTFEVPSLHLGARFEQGLTNINAIDDRDKWKNQSFQLFAGLTF